MQSDKGQVEQTLDHIQAGLRGWEPVVPLERRPAVDVVHILVDFIAGHRQRETTPQINSFSRNGDSACSRNARLPDPMVLASLERVRSGEDVGRVPKNHQRGDREPSQDPWQRRSETSLERLIHQQQVLVPASTLRRVWGRDILGGFICRGPNIRYAQARLTCKLTCL